VKTPIRFFEVGSEYWLRDKASPLVLATIANGCNSSVEVGNIFCETRILAFSHSLGRDATAAHLARAAVPAAQRPLKRNLGFRAANVRFPAFGVRNEGPLFEWS
jgi:hypothetical protein